MINQIDLKNNIKEFSFSIGINKVGFAKYRVFDTEIKLYENWLSLGYNASMDYLERNIEKRRDLSLILPEIKSVIVFALSYNTGFQHKSGNFKISRYAWGDDYHKIFEKKLKKVANFIKQSVDNFKYKIYVDTGPVLEKLWAIEAGIGWQGKNSLVLSKELGSYFFIGIMLVNLDFEPDRKVVDHCGRCNRCIQSCPTQAIVEPKVVDSRKCISFWTIEKKVTEDIPTNLDLKGWIFGCDICQEVCPWNKKALLTDEIGFYPRNGLMNLPKQLFENLTSENFREIFKNSPIKRAKYDGLVKNFQHIMEKNENK